MDDIDRQIVALLRQDARRSFQSIGLKVALSAPAVKRRVDRLEADGVIRGYSAQVDPGRYGWGTHAFVELYCEGRMAAAEVRDAASTPRGRGASPSRRNERVVHCAPAKPHTSIIPRAAPRPPGVTRPSQIVLSTLFERPLPASSGALPGLSAGGITATAAADLALAHREVKRLPIAPGSVA